MQTKPDILEELWQHPTGQGSGGEARATLGSHCPTKPEPGA